MEPCGLGQEEQKPCSSWHPAHSLQLLHRWEREWASVPGKRDTHMCSKGKKFSAFCAMFESSYIFASLCSRGPLFSLATCCHGWLIRCQFPDTVLPWKGAVQWLGPLWAGHDGRHGQGGRDLNFHLDVPFDDASYRFFEEMSSEGKNQQSDMQEAFVGWRHTALTLRLSD